MELGDIVVAEWGYNSVTEQPFRFLFEFGYNTETYCIVYKKGCSNMQDSMAFKKEEIRLATEEDKNNISWYLR